MEKISAQKNSRLINSITLNRIPPLVISLMLVAAFGPYLVGSVRTEQIAVYGLFVLALPAILTRFNPRGGLRFLVPWGLYIIVATLGVVAPFSGMPYRSGSLLAGYDNILAPLIIMLLIWSLVPSHCARDLLILSAKIVAVAMAINGLLAVSATVWDLSSFLRPFWGSAISTWTVAENAATMGRSTGIFNHPAEAGALYGLAGVAAIFAWRERPFILVLLIPVIVIGGLVSVSKIFVLGGAVIIALYWFWASSETRNMVPFIAAIFALIGIMQLEVIADWSGLSYLQRLFVTEDQSLVELYGAGRFDEGSTFFRVVAAALAVSPLAGVGAAGWQVPYDGAVAEFVVIGGVLGLGLLGIVLAAMFSLSLSLNSDLNLRIFAFLVFLLTFISSLGFSPLTGNRVATITWILIALLVLAIRYRSSESSEQETGSLTRRRL